MFLEGGGVRGRAARVAAVGPPADGVEPAVPEVVEAAPGGGPGQAGEAEEVGPGEAVGGEAEEFHPPLDLGARVVVAVVVDPGEDIGREVEGSHGVLPGAECEARSDPETGRRGKLSSPRAEYSAGSMLTVCESGRGRTLAG